MSNGRVFPNPVTYYATPVPIENERYNQPKEAHVVIEPRSVHEKECHNQPKEAHYVIVIPPQLVLYGV